MITISLCMIVKNEEKNIEKALSWGKGHVFEQIVVDTGSTDKTVEIAESMGAKVFHFEWINDFSAAKNYAIKQAKGNWIAFLDADEYFPEDDARRLMMILRNIEADQKYSKMKSAIRCPIVNVDDAGKPFLLLRQDRVFRNSPDIYYSGKIHEILVTKDPHFQAAELSIIHTGYTNSAYAETGKATRNVDMIREELRRDPDNANLKCYLADSLRASGEIQDVADAETLYREALASNQDMLIELKQGAFNYLIAKNYEEEVMKNEVFEMCKEAYEQFPDNPDFCYYLGRKLYERGEYGEAWEMLIACEVALNRDIVSMGGFILSHSMMLFFLMVLTAEELGNLAEVIRCATLVLKEDKYQPLILAPYIQAFNRPGYQTSAEDIFQLLNKLYNFEETKDKVAVMRAAKDAGNMELVGKVVSMFTSEELEWLTADLK